MEMGKVLHVQISKYGTVTWLKYGDRRKRLGLKNADMPFVRCPFNDDGTCHIDCPHVAVDIQSKSIAFSCGAETIVYYFEHFQNDSNQGD